MTALQMLFTAAFQTSVDAQRGREAHNESPSIDFEKFGHKNALKPKNRGPPPDFLTTSNTSSNDF
jgi:hypothetical protein